jgi:predicted PurR-regulated permease PerM
VRAAITDVLLAALLAALALGLTAGLGVVAAIALPVIVLGCTWIGLERVVRRNSHRLFRKRTRGRARPV